MKQLVCSPLNPFFSYTSRRPVSPTRSLVPLASSSSSVQAVREDSLIQCYNDLNARERLSAMDILRTVSDDYDMNRRICFAVVQVIRDCFYFIRLITGDSFRKHFQLLNVALMNGNCVFVRNLR